MVDYLNLVEGCNTWNLIPNIEAFLIMFIVFFGKESMFFPFLYLLIIFETKYVNFNHASYKENCKEIPKNSYWAILFYFAKF